MAEHKHTIHTNKTIQPSPTGAYYHLFWAPPPGEQFPLTKIKQLSAFLSNVNLEVIVLEKWICGKTKDGQDIVYLLISDDTGSCHLKVIGSEAESIIPSEILRLTAVSVSFFLGSMILSKTRQSKMERIGSFALLFVHIPNISLFEWTNERGERLHSGSKARTANFDYDSTLCCNQNSTFLSSSLNAVPPSMREKYKRNADMALITRKEELRRMADSVMISKPSNLNQRTSQSLQFSSDRPHSSLKVSPPNSSAFNPSLFLPSSSGSVQSYKPVAHPTSSHSSSSSSSSSTLPMPTQFTSSQQALLPPVIAAPILSLPSQPAAMPADSSSASSKELASSSSSSSSLFPSRHSSTPPASNFTYNPSHTPSLPSSSGSQHNALSDTSPSSLPYQPANSFKYTPSSSSPSSSSSSSSSSLSSSSSSSRGTSPSSSSSSSSSSPSFPSSSSSSQFFQYRPSSSSSSASASLPSSNTFRPSSQEHHSHSSDHSLNYRSLSPHSAPSSSMHYSSSALLPSYNSSLPPSSSYSSHSSLPRTPQSSMPSYSSHMQAEQSHHHSRSPQRAYGQSSSRHFGSSSIPQNPRDYESNRRDHRR